jgi:hypothetical protein
MSKWDCKSNRVFFEMLQASHSLFVVLSTLEM